ncbi:amidohydrolase [Comamonas granuli]|uniref:amidohydrolase n=1 Tax=Comamonas granuli TaxID=290309 RepID=UPI0005A6CCB2|nr:amidohydrolase [Comamonas granuli]
MPQESILIRGARPWGLAHDADVLIDNGRIAAVGPGLQAPGAGRILEAQGCMVLPGYVDAHAHVDKTLWGLPWHPHQAGPTLIDRIENEQRVMKELRISSELQSARLLRHMVARGTTHVRTHIDVGLDMGLSYLHGVLAMYEAHRDYIDMEMVAFPQTGVMMRPGTLDLLDQAVQAGAQVLGGLDPIGVDQNPEGQLDGLFAIAERRGCALDIHLHDRGEVGARTLEMVADRIRALGMRGRVAISHAFCLGGLDEARLEQMVELLLEHDIAIMTHGPVGGIPFPPVRLLAERGVRLFTGSDGVRDCWSPLNTGDMLERAFLISYLNGFRDDPGLEITLRMATYGGAQLMGVQDYGLTPGCTADLVVVPASCAAEAVAAHPLPRYVLKRGRIVAQDGQALLPPLA